jgi:hypothetical protein
LKSAVEYPKIIATKIVKELKANRISGLFSEKPFNNLKISPIGVVPKKEQGEYRMIHHLSNPRNTGTSINDQIPSDFTEVSYENIVDAISIIKSQGRHTYMAKTDICSAF